MLCLKMAYHSTTFASKTSVMEKIYIKRNRPIATVLKEYLERRPGKVSDARNELHQRFEYLDWNIQKKIIIAHLQSSKSDRQWVYPRLLRYWDDSFLPVVKKVWETYYEERCAWSVIRYFSKEYVMANLNTLQKERNYYFICLRFADDKDFAIDKSKLSPMDYLSFCQKTQRKIEPDEALLYLYEVAIDCILDYHAFTLEFVAFGDTEDKIDPLNLRNMGKAFWYVKQMEIEPAISQFSEWCHEVALVSTKEWIDVRNDYPRRNNNTLANRIVLKKMGERLSKNILDRFIKVNPNLQTLIDKLALEVDFTHMIEELKYQ